MKYFCPICKKNFFSYNRKRKSCSKHCSAIFQSRHITKYCEHCGKAVTRTKGKFKKRTFCSTTCTHKQEAIERVKFPSLRNKEWCVEQYKTMSLIKIAKMLGCGETTVYKFFKIHGIPLDRIQWIKGSRNYGWKDGITPLIRAIRNLYEYRKWRKEVFNNSPKECIFCGSTQRLEVDHIKQFKFILVDNNIKSLEQAKNCKELWDIKNGRILCRNCNAIRQ